MRWGFGQSAEHEVAHCDVDVSSTTFDGSLVNLKKMPKLQSIWFPCGVELEKQAKKRIDKHLQGVSIGWDHL